MAMAMGIFPGYRPDSECARPGAEPGGPSRSAPMIIDHFNTDLIGGAAVAALRLHQGLMDSEIASRFWYRPCKDYAPYEKLADSIGNIRAVPWSRKSRLGTLFASS